MGFEVRLSREDFIENKMTGRFAILMQEVEKVVRLTPDFVYQGQSSCSEFVLLTWFGANLGDDCIRSAGNFVVRANYRRRRTR